MPRLNVTRISGLHAQKGFAYLWVLLLVAVLGVGMTVTGQIYSTSLQREKEQELLFIGRQFREAIRRYHAVPGGADRQGEYPATLEALLHDPRAPETVRHLRRIYVDPMTGKAEWGEVRVAGKIAGVYSLSSARPKKQAGFEPEEASLNGASHYSDWVFSYPANVVVSAPTAP